MYFCETKRINRFLLSFKNTCDILKPLTNNQDQNFEERICCEHTFYSLLVVTDIRLPKLMFGLLKM